MRKTPLLILAAVVWFPAVAPAQTETLTEVTFPEFLTHYEESLHPVDQAYEEMANENLPLRDETGQALGRRHIEDRRQVVVSLHQTIRQLAANPQDLVLTTKLFFQTETLVDDLFDLSQIAYDNDREELAKTFSDLETALDHNDDLIEAYVLRLAAAKQERIEQLEKENQDLQKRVKEAAEHQKAKPHSP
jgi:DNA anti-recombination protein RmuC